MTTRFTRGIAAAAVVATTAAALVGTAGSGWAQPLALRAFGISTDGKVMTMFTTDRPTVLDWVREITGLSGDTSLIGIDFRVQNGLMYGVGDQGGIYTITTPPQTDDVVVTKVSQLGVALYGTNFGVDFNPAADRLRVVANTGQNLRHNLATHATDEDAVLTTPPALGPARGVSAAAYTNNDLDASTATTLFDINTATDQLVIQSPANNGTLAAVGSLGFDAQANAGLDIYSDLTGGRTTSVSFFATLTPAGGSSTFYGVNPFTGATTSLGRFPLGISDVAIALDAG
ncbi:DUF4394 domain-containing protein [Saccharothrix sp. Mg75]|uniref:DUF4394 domain-containing protein n=1 Tax=Saccharothrix sp. Mg75 TaxID=3445357 RepID=UPI003EED6512